MLRKVCHQFNAASQKLWFGASSYTFLKRFMQHKFIRQAKFPKLNLFASTLNYQLNDSSRKVCWNRIDDHWYSFRNCPYHITIINEKNLLDPRIPPFKKTCSIVAIALWAVVNAHIASAKFGLRAPSSDLSHKFSNTLPDWISDQGAQVAQLGMYVRNSFNASPRDWNSAVVTVVVAVVAAAGAVGFQARKLAPTDPPFYRSYRCTNRTVNLQLVYSL